MWIVEERHSEGRYVVSWRFHGPFRSQGEAALWIELQEAKPGVGYYRHPVFRWQWPGED